MNGTQNHRRSKRSSTKWLLALCTVASAVGALASSASASTYTGDIDGLPESRVSLSFERSQGHLFLRVFDWFGTPWCCEDSSAELVGSTYNFAPPEGRVTRRSFEVRATAPENHYLFFARGVLEDGGGATGVLRYKSNGFDPSNGVCDTGPVRWTARRGR